MLHRTGPVHQSFQLLTNDLKRVCAFAVAAIALTTSAWAQAAAPRERAGAHIDETQRLVIPGHMLPVLAHAQETGRVAPDTAMRHLIMVLQPSREQDHALQTLLDQQLDNSSPNFHHWLTPEEFGARFGVADADIAKVTAWMAQHGLTVEQVAKNKRMIQFSGSVAKVEEAFATEMHTYLVNGKPHVANSKEISVPAALQNVIAGVPTLHDFFKTSDFHMNGTVATARAAEAARRFAASNSSAATPTGKSYLADPGRVPFSAPDYTSGSTHFVGAGDFASIYNTTPLLTAGNDGTGISIGVVGRTDLNLSDIQIYRTMFNLKPNDPAFVVVGEDPGVVGGDDGESYLDVEISGGAAPGAAVKFVTSRASLTTDGVDLSAMYIVDNNLTDIISESYGQCEANFSPVALTFYSNLWGQAAAQGQSVFVSSGDNGPAACDSSSSSSAAFGYGVSGLASTPFNVAVGGTLFADTAANWNATATTAPPFASALGYIPEVPWNESRSSGAVGASELWSGSGGISSYIALPVWQTGFGVPVADPSYLNFSGTAPFAPIPLSPVVPGPHRLMPDVSMAAAAQHDGTLYCAEGICQLSNTGGLVNAGIVGGTSVAAPSMAGVQALIDQFNGGRQGMPNYVYYVLANNQHTSGFDCAANSATLNPSCNFRDVTTGNNYICGATSCTGTANAGSTVNRIGWAAGPGYDLATGLGSPNVNNLATNWATVTFRSTSTSLNASQTTGLTHGQSVTLSGGVLPSSGPGTPTGNVTFIPSSGALGNPMDPNTGAFLNPPPLATLDGSGNYSIPVTNLPAGTYTVVARYGGDANFAASMSAPITMTVSNETSTVTLAPNAFNGTTCVETAQSTFNYGSYIWTDVIVAGTSGQGAPTGTVTLTDNGNPLMTTILNAQGAAHFLSGAVPTSSCVSGYTFQDTPTLAVGSHLIAAVYSGDPSFGPSSNSTTITVVAVNTTTPALTTQTPTIASGGSAHFTFTVAGISGAGPGTLSPTGTVTFDDTTTATSLGSAPLVPNATFGAVAVFNTSLITTAGAHSVTATWSGDTNYNGLSSGAVTVTVSSGTATSVAVTSNTNPAALGGRPTWTATMTPTMVTSGTVSFVDTSASPAIVLGTGTVGAAHTATFRPAAAVNLPAGVHNIVAYYGGSATFVASISAPFAQTFNQAATTIQLTVKSSGTWGQQFEMAAVLGTIVAATAPSGTIQFLDGVTPLNPTQHMTSVPAAQGGFALFDAQYGAQLTAGTHTITATLADPNYTAATSNSQTINVAKANPTVVATGGIFTYDGNPHGGTGSATGGASESLPVTFAYVGTGSTTYGPSATAPTGAGTYSVTVSTTGDSNNNSGNSSPQTITINKGNSTTNVLVTGSPFTYNGAAHGATATSTGAAGETLAATIAYTGTGATTYGPTSTAPTNVGTYQASASTVGDANNNASTSATPASFSINKATDSVTLSVTGTPFTYNGSPHGASGSATDGAGNAITVTLSYLGTGGTSYGPSSTAPINAGNYQVAGTTAGDANNNGITSSPAAFAINKATASVNVTGYCTAFDSAAHTATGSATGVLSESLTGLNLTSTSHSAGGTYPTDPWNFANQNYANQNGTVGDSIVDVTIAAPTAVAPNGHGTASVPDGGTGATYTWSIDNGTVTGGSGTRTINFGIGTVPVTLHVTVLTTTGCSKTNSVEVAAQDPAEVPTLTPVGLAILAALLALTGAIVVARRRRA